MGGSGSTRRVVVEEVDGSGVVKISDSVVQRIRGQGASESVRSSSSSTGSSSTSSTGSSSTASTGNKSVASSGSSSTAATGNISAFTGSSSAASTGRACNVSSSSPSTSQFASLKGSPVQPSQPTESCPAPPPSSFVPPARGALPSSLPPPPAVGKNPSVKDIEAYYLEKLEQLEVKNSELQKITNEQFVKAVQEVEQKFLKHNCVPVCQELQAKVYECYLGNPQHTLNCSPHVRAFSTCVERARKSALLRKS